MKFDLDLLLHVNLSYVIFLMVNTILTYILFYRDVVRQYHQSLRGVYDKGSNIRYV